MQILNHLLFDVLYEFLYQAQCLSVFPHQEYRRLFERNESPGRVATVGGFFSLLLLVFWFRFTCFCHSASAGVMVYILYFLIFMGVPVIIWFSIFNML